jgi:hypothetical protein
MFRISAAPPKSKADSRFSAQLRTPILQPLLRRIPILISLALLATMICIRDATAASECVVSMPFDFPVDIRRDNVSEEFDTTRTELARLAEALNPGGYLPLGVYTAELGYKLDLKTSVREVAPHAFCATLISTRMHIMLSARLLHFAKEIRMDPCLLQSTRAHVMRHALVDDQVLEDNAGDLPKKLRMAMSALKIEAANSDAIARALLMRAVARAVEIEFDALDDDRKKLNLAINSSANLSKQREACQTHVGKREDLRAAD